MEAAADTSAQAGLRQELIDRTATTKGAGNALMQFRLHDVS
uniref:Uncharacterized protein n=1 Tax=Faecalibaculum rodentium TaxID=1702221 RepID=A0A140DUZ5_9FIRM|nr:hypothetical protein AALO17_13380 [Faecalibaculum rodentium]